jgi:hypothetical protein
MTSRRRPYPGPLAALAARAGFALLALVLVAALLSPRRFPAVPAALALGGAMWWFFVRELPHSFHLRRSGDFDEDGDWPEPVPLDVPEPELPDPWADLAPALLDEGPDDA